MKRVKKAKNRYNFLIDSAVYDDFSLICDELGLVRSKKLENYMKTFIDENVKVLKRLKGE